MYVFQSKIRGCYVYKETWHVVCEQFQRCFAVFVNAIISIDIDIDIDIDNFYP